MGAELVVCIHLILGHILKVKKTNLVRIRIIWGLTILTDIATVAIWTETRVRRWGLDNAGTAIQTRLWLTWIG